jgi:hypothetical protein
MNAYDEEMKDLQEKGRQSLKKFISLLKKLRMEKTDEKKKAIFEAIQHQKIKIIEIESLLAKRKLDDIEESMR